MEVGVDKMRTKTIKVYKFEKLSKDVQEKLIEETRNNPHYLDYGWWDFMLEDFKERLSEIGIECKTFYFDFYPKFIKMDSPRVIDDIKFLTSAGLGKELMMMSLENKNRINNISININDKRDNYNSVCLEFYDLEDEDIEPMVELFGSSEELDEKLTDYLQNVLDGFLKELEKEYDYMNSDEYIREDLLNRDDEYDKEGNRL